MPIVAITREMGTLGSEVADGLGRAMDVPVIYHEEADHLADRMRVRKSHVIRLLDGRGSLLERLTADKTSLAIYSADEIFGLALQGKGAVIRGWGATHLLRGVPHVVCVRVCSPLEVRKRRMMDRLDTGDEKLVGEEIHSNDEAHTAIMRRNFSVSWTDAEHYDMVLNTERIGAAECVAEVMRLIASPAFAETEASRWQLENLALAARVRAALRRSLLTRDTKASVSAKDGLVTLSGNLSTEILLAAAEVVSGVEGVRDYEYRVRGGEAG